MVNIREADVSIIIPCIISDKMSSHIMELVQISACIMGLLWQISTRNISLAQISFCNPNNGFVTRHWGVFQIFGPLFLEHYHVESF